MLSLSVIVTVIDAVSAASAVTVIAPVLAFITEVQFESYVVIPNVFGVVPELAKA